MTTLRNWSAVFVAVLLGSAAVGARGDGPGPSRGLPAEGIAAYAEFDGLDAHAKAWEVTAAHAVLTKTPAGAMVESLARQVTGRLVRDLPGKKLSGEDVAELGKHIARRGFAAAAYSHGDDGPSWALVVPGAGGKESRPRFERLFRPLVESKNGRVTRLKGRDVLQYVRDGGDGPSGAGGEPPARLSWWFEGGSLFVVGQKSGKSDAGTAAAVLDALDGKARNASDHPGRAAALAEGKDVAGFEGDGLFFVEPGQGGALRKALARAFEKPDTGLTLPPVNYFDPSTVEGLRMPGPEPEYFTLHPIVTPPDAPVPPAAPAPAPAPTPAPDVPGPPQASIPGPLPRVGAHPRPAPAPKADILPRPIREIPNAPVVDEPDLLQPPPPPGAADPLGLDGIKRVAGRWGFHKHALLTVVRLEAPSPRKGVLAWLDGTPFRKDALPPIPAGAAGFTVISFDAARTSGAALSTLKTLMPQAAGPVAAVEKGLRELTGMTSLGDVFKQVGPTWSLVMAFP